MGTDMDVDRDASRVHLRMYRSHKSMECGASPPVMERAPSMVVAFVMSLDGTEVEITASVEGWMFSEEAFLTPRHK